MPDKEYILFCDESELKGRYFSNFYGGVMVGSSQYERVTSLLNEEKNRLNLLGEVKWSKVTRPYLTKYQELMQAFFKEVAAGHLRVRIMFRQNAHVPVGLTQDQLDGSYFRLYYQFIRHAFGLMQRPEPVTAAKLRLYFDQFPETGEAAAQFKGYLLALGQNSRIKAAGFTLLEEDVAEFRSHDHVLAQCLDVVLGSMAFRLNNRHKDKPEGSRYRGQRTIAKELLYKSILREVQAIRPGLNIGISTGLGGDFSKLWSAPYLHWRFIPNQREWDHSLTKP